MHMSHQPLFCILLHLSPKLPNMAPQHHGWHFATFDVISVVFGDLGAILAVTGMAPLIATAVEVALT